jgi:hypothetical protein
MTELKLSFAAVQSIKLPEGLRKYVEPAATYFKEKAFAA